jgi:hypothetical protein
MLRRVLFVYQRRATRRIEAQVTVGRNGSVGVAVVLNALVDTISMAVGSALSLLRGRSVLAHVWIH